MSYLAARVLVYSFAGVAKEGTQGGNAPLPPLIGELKKNGYRGLVYATS